MYINSLLIAWIFIMPFEIVRNGITNMQVDAIVNVAKKIKKSIALIHEEDIA